MIYIFFISCFHFVVFLSSTTRHSSPCDDKEIMKQYLPIFKKKSFISRGTYRLINCVVYLFKKGFQSD